MHLKAQGVHMPCVHTLPCDTHCVYTHAHWMQLYRTVTEIQQNMHNC